MLEVQQAQQTTGFVSILENSKNELSRIEELKSRPVSKAPRNIFFGASFFVLVMLMGFFAFQIISGIFAIVLLLASGIGIFFALRFLKALDPLVRQKTRNLVMNKMAMEARKNAIAQLDNQIIVNAERLNVARAARDKMGAAVESLRNQIDEKNKGKPNYERKVQILTRVEAAYHQTITNLDNAAKANQKFESKVKEYKEMESFAAQANEAMSIFRNTGDSQLEEILSLEAFKQIEVDFNAALIGIENNVRDMNIDEDDSY
ncbi:hypothetical protein ACKC9G_01265 [Pokkaliibacter sp. CJK22405]|uniref:hypothetical protein n=1 Tax=Pokkaliibacter sp. CJK22405 TaxID=3384615 RepID=UPI0039848D93